MDLAYEAALPVLKSRLSDSEHQTVRILYWLVRGGQLLPASPIGIVPGGDR